jgi:hypothetical protein
MGPHHRLLPSPTMLVAAIALIVAFGGTAAALSGKDTVAHNDLKNNVVHTEEIKKEQVKSSDLADAEAFRRVGDSGHPPFATGGEGDCEWLFSTLEIATNPIGFYKDPYDTVHLVGAVTNEDDPGGDGVCEFDDPGEIEDAIVFTLPGGYQPENPTILGVANSESLVVGDDAAVIGGENLPPGSVVALDGTQTILDGSTFRAASADTESIDLDTLQRASLESLRRALR